MTDRHSRREITHRPARVRGATHRPDPRKALPLRRGGLRTVARQTNAQTRSPRCRAPRRPRRAQRRRRRRTMATRLRGRRHTHRSVHGRRTRCAREGRRRPLAIPVASGLEAPGQTLPNTTLNHESSRRRLDLRPRDRAGVLLPIVGILNSIEGRDHRPLVVSLRRPRKLDDWRPPDGG